MTFLAKPVEDPRKRSPGRKALAHHGAFTPARELPAELPAEVGEFLPLLNRKQRRAFETKGRLDGKRKAKIEARKAANGAHTVIVPTLEVEKP